MFKNKTHGCFSKQVMAMLGRAGSWQFDSFQLNDVSGGRPLSLLGFFLFKRYEVSGCKPRDGQCKPRMGNDNNILCSLFDLIDPIYPDKLDNPLYSSLTSSNWTRSSSRIS